MAPLRQTSAWTWWRRIAPLRQLTARIAATFAMYVSQSPLTAEEVPHQALRPNSPTLRAPANQRLNPLTPILKLVSTGQQRIKSNVRGYTCEVVMRERIDGKLSEYRYLTAKVRHRRKEDGKVTPFSVYMRYHAPRSLAGREVLYVEGANDDRLVARKGGVRLASLTLNLKPTSDTAMQDSRYPITEFGFANLTRRLIEVAEHEMVTQDSSVQYFKNAKVDRRVCTGVTVRQRTRDPSDRFSVARVYIDNELRIPIHYEAYDWPASEGGKPRLLEQYTYRNLRLNPGLTDRDFRRDNPKYGFRKQKTKKTSIASQSD